MTVTQNLHDPTGGGFLLPTHLVLSIAWYIELAGFQAHHLSCASRSDG